MRQPYRDLYALFRHEPRAEEYFNALPDSVRDEIGARYQSVDSMERLEYYAQRARRTAAGEHYPVEEIGGRAYLPSPVRF